MEFVRYFVYDACISTTSHRFRPLYHLHIDNIVGSVSYLSLYKPWWTLCKTKKWNISTFYIPIILLYFHYLMRCVRCACMSVNESKCFLWLLSCFYWLIQCDMFVTITKSNSNAYQWKMGKKTISHYNWAWDARPFYDAILVLIPPLFHNFLVW